MCRITAGHLETSSSRCFRGLIQTPPAADEDVRIRSFAYFAFVMRGVAWRRVHVRTYVCRGVLSLAPRQIDRLPPGPSYSREREMLSPRLSGSDTATNCADLSDRNIHLAVFVVRPFFGDLLKKILSNSC